MYHEELFFWIGPAQIISVLVPIIKYPVKATMFASQTRAVVAKPLFRVVILNE